MKKILMSMRVTEAPGYDEKRNSIAFEYISFFEELGYMIIFVPNNSKYIENYFEENIDFIVLSGGNNVNPLLYKSNGNLSDVYRQRDETERLILNLAIKKSIKVLGICRGLHFINVYFGGSLTHNILNHVNKKHILKSDNKILNLQQANSFHNYAILKNNLSNHLEALAINQDVIEAVINKDKTILGIQWHPERQGMEFDKKLIKSFIEGKL